MIENIANWVDKLVSDYLPQARCCSELHPSIKQYFPRDFLENSYFIITNDIPKLDIQFESSNVESFINMDGDGITYKNLYFIKEHRAFDPTIHVHELVHVAQWKLLGVTGFIEKYINELENCGYNDAPLEKMAYAIEDRFALRNELFDITSVVKDGLKKLYGV
ncbi:hypothetical protein [Pseudoalteromonas gelatinilytica]|uniref:DUF4157 domain-containing protein n=1 Tax=Pseudoalteromonas gelatinilytica TaxID=1703256 RepID=A0A3A3EJ92_9GAMM|nr:hypothetical protein [Pseudoalteromonas profundi]RJF35772.1 hypothetical protein D4741_12445 [Pseudoalteromonas profundi]